MKWKFLKVTVAVLTVLILFSSPVFANGGQEQDTGEKGEGDQIFLGLAAHSVRNSWEDLYVKAFNWYCADQGIRSTWTQAGYDAASQITQAKRLIDMGIDGLLISPWNVEALRSVMDYAEEHNTPVICTNTIVNHDYPLMFVGYGARRAAQTLGEKIVDYLRNEVEPVGEVQGTVLELSSGPGTSEDVMRGGGFHDIVDQYENITVITVVAKSDRAQAKTKTLNTIRSGKQIDAVFSQNGSMGLGASGAFQSADGVSAKDVFIATVDAFPDVLDEIKAGNIDVAVDQTPQFYNPIAVHYMVRYLKDGETALPDYGEEVTTDDLTIRTGEKHAGLDPWKDPMWAPAVIKHATEYSEAITEDYRWFATNAVVVTAENADSPLLWGNFPLPGW